MLLTEYAVGIFHNIQSVIWLCFICYFLFSGDAGSGWMMNRLKDGSKFYYNTHSKEYKWAKPDAVVKDHGILTKDEIQVSIKVQLFLSETGLERKCVSCQLQ